MNAVLNPMRKKNISMRSLKPEAFESTTRRCAVCDVLIRSGELLHKCSDLRINNLLKKDLAKDAQEEKDLADPERTISDRLDEADDLTDRN